MWVVSKFCVESQNPVVNLHTCACALISTPFSERQKLYLKPLDGYPLIRMALYGGGGAKDKQDICHCTGEYV